jgi:hypothetical protein
MVDNSLIVKKNEDVIKKYKSVRQKIRAVIAIIKE